MDAFLLTNPNFSPLHFGRKLNWKKPRTYGAVTRSPRCATDTMHGDNLAKPPKFPRMKVWDPYKRLGISPYASEEEIWGSRNFLLEQYAGHERSEESVEAAFEKILMTSFRERKKTKINLKSRLKKKVEESPPWVKSLLDFVEVPPTEIILRRLFLFGFMGAWSVMKSADGGPAFQDMRNDKYSFNGPGSLDWFHGSLSVMKSAEGGPGFQVAASLGACIYFLNDKTKSIARASILGFGALVTGWICGSFLVPMVPSVLLQPTWTLELLTSLVAYVFLFLACTFLK